VSGGTAQCDWRPTGESCVLNQSIPAPRRFQALNRPGLLPLAEEVERRLLGNWLCTWRPGQLEITDRIVFEAVCAELDVSSQRLDDEVAQWVYRAAYIAWTNLRSLSLHRIPADPPSIDEMQRRREWALEWVRSCGFKFQALMVMPRLGIFGVHVAELLPKAVLDEILRLR